MFKAGFYEAEITPPLGGVIPGHFSNDRGEDIYDRLYAKAVVINNGKETVAMVVIDSCEIPKGYHDAVTKRVYEYTGIKPENVTVMVNHTHAGAPTTPNNDVGGYVDEGYVRNVFFLAADCITLAYRRMEKCKIKYGKSEIYGYTFNRNFVKRHGVIDTNTGWEDDEVQPLNIPDDIPVVKIEDAQKRPGIKIYNPNCEGNLAGIDPEFTVLSFERENGELIGAISNFALHQAVNDNYKNLTGDYSSILSKELKKEYGEDFVSFFAIGCCGDINNVDFSRGYYKDDDQYRKVGRALAEETKKIIPLSSELSGDDIKVGKELITLKRRHADSELVNKTIKLCAEGKLPAGTMILRTLLNYSAGPENKKENVEAYVQCMKIGDLYFYAFPGEMYVDFGLDIKKRSPGEKVIVTELANGPYSGYVPIRAAFHKNSLLYEIFPNNDSNMEPEGGYIMVEKALEIANNLKNK